MKKALLAAMCFVVVSLMLVNGTFALPNFGDVFQAVVELGKNGIPEMGGEGTAVDVALISDNSPHNLYPGGTASRSTSVKNTGTGDVYFRLVYAIQYDEEHCGKLNIQFSAGDGFVDNGWKNITIDGTPYKMKVFTYKQKLPVGASSPEVGISITMGNDITNEQMANYRSDFLQIRALAIDPGPFAEAGYTTAEAALDKALPLGTLNPF